MINEIYKKSYTVYELNSLIKDFFDTSEILHNIKISGEVSNFRGANISGHAYFTLKDEKSILKAVIFKYNFSLIKFNFKDGDKVIATGDINVYPPNGTYQLIIKKLELDGEGDILLKREKLKNKLFLEGYFSHDHKIKIPKFPKSIAIITGKNSAASEDLIANIKRRYPLIVLHIFYSLVQGEEAAKDIIDSLHMAVKTSPSTIIFGRGGGSIEDLLAFDDENLVKEIFNCKIPIISAIGHEINLSFCDLAADAYASTPTGAAELAVPDKNDLIASINQNKQYLDSLMSNAISRYESKLLKLINDTDIQSITSIYDEYLHKIDKNRILINEIIDNRIDFWKQKLLHNENMIENINPNAILKKGYSIVFDNNGNIITNIDTININDNLSIKLNRGFIKAKVEEKNNGNE